MGLLHRRRTELHGMYSKTPEKAQSTRAQRRERDKRNRQAQTPQEIELRRAQRQKVIDACVILIILYSLIC